MRVEEQQRIFSFIPNTYVIYDPHPEPLTAKMKFHLAYKSLTPPTLFGFMAVWAGIQQAANTPDWPRNIRGYGERFGANLAGAASEGLFANAILLRFFIRTPDIIIARLSVPAIRKLQPNYSQWGGLLVSGALANITTRVRIAAPGLYSEIRLTWASMFSSVWRKSLS